MKASPQPPEKKSGQALSEGEGTGPSPEKVPLGTKYR